MSAEEPMQITPAPEPDVAAAPAEPAPVQETPAPEVVTATEPVAAVEPTPPAGTALLTDKVQNVIKDEKEAATAPRAKADVQSLPTRQYLDQSVVPILLQAFTALSKERPPDAIDFLVAYLMKNKTSFQQQSS